MTPGILNLIRACALGANMAVAVVQAAAGQPAPAFAHLSLCLISISLGSIR